MSDKLSMAEAVQMAYAAQDLHCSVRIEFLTAKHGEANIGPPGRRGFSSLEDILKYMENIETDITRMRTEIESLRYGRNLDTEAKVRKSFKQLVGRSHLFTPVATVAEVETLSQIETVNGYHAGRRNEPEPFDKGKAYWHGWRNGMIDAHHMPMDYPAQFLAQAIVRASAEKKEKN